MGTQIRQATDADFAWLLGERGPPAGLRQPDDGVDAPEILAIVCGLTASLHAAGCEASWLILDSETVVGLVSFKQAPDVDGVAEIGYGIAPLLRRRGHARAAVALVIEEVVRRRLATSLRAETSVDNLPSQMVLERNGFIQTGMRHDEEDGDLICWSYAIA